MIKSYIFVLSILFTSNIAFCQINTLNGIILDIDSHDAVQGATIIYSAKNGVISDNQGLFTITVKSFPAKLSISHISYGVVLYEFPESEKDTIRIFLRQIRRSIPEALISGKLLQELSSSVDYSIGQFEFDKFYMWMIGYVNNNPNNCRLFLCNLIGDTLSSISLNKQAYLKTDIFGNVHLVEKDSIYQLTGLNNHVGLLYGERKELYDRIVTGWHAVLGDGLVRVSQNPKSEQVELNYIDSTLSDLISIYTSDINFDLDTSWLPNNLKILSNILGVRTVKQILMQQLEYFSENRGPLFFKAMDTVYLLDFRNSKMHPVGPDRLPGVSKIITFHHNQNPSFSNLYKCYNDILVDLITDKVYLIYRNNNTWDFVPLDLTNGKTRNSLELPDFSAMTNVRIHDNYLYFIYPEKKYPFFQRVFRKRITDK